MIHKDCKRGWFLFSAITVRQIHNLIKLRKHITFKHKAGKSGIGFYRCNYKHKKYKI